MMKNLVCYTGLLFCVLLTIPAAADDNVLWTWSDAGSGYSYLECKAYADVHFSTVSGTPPFVMNADESSRAKWKTDDAADGYVYIWNQYFWTSWRFYSADGETIKMQSGTPTDDGAKWLLQDAGDGYFFVINKAYNKMLRSVDGASAFELVDSGVETTPPAVVEDLTVGGGHGFITLNWQAPLDEGSSPVQAYHIYRGPDAANLSQIAEVSATTFEWTDDTVDNEVAYTYAVSAANATDEGAVSEVYAFAEWNLYDLDKNGVINIKDLAILAADWLWQAPWYE